MEGWKDKGTRAKYEQSLQQKIDAEDADREQEMEGFEHAYNFRFEEPNSQYLVTHSRVVEESLRRKDESRKDKRERKREKKEAEKRAKTEELARAREAKREEVLEKLRKAEFVAGMNKGGILDNKMLLEKAEKELKTEFIPELYDKTMEKVFGEKYYEGEDDDEFEP
mmetsp:Transcript_9403/g.7178  ORF Transcript_9403/g.7178 Transcript_9403/m.7178 type:complete len:167 (+) Transcript_9403:182-682(+)